MIWAFIKQSWAEEWRKQSVAERRMLINAAPSMIVGGVVIPLIALGVPIPPFDLFAVAGVVQLLWSACYLGWTLTKEWRKARAAYKQWPAQLADARAQFRFATPRD